MNPSQLKTFLSSIDQRPSKRLSQNFLVDNNIVNKTLNLADIQPGDLIVEIGPGAGALTDGLLKRGAHVIAIEKDKRLALSLQRFDSSLEIYAEDILSFPLINLIKNRLKKGQKGKIISNLPYHLTTPILTTLLPLNTHFSEMIVMMQKEVAERLLAKKGGKNYGSLSLFAQFYSILNHSFHVSSTCFYPRPKISSSVVHLQLKKPSAQVDPSHLFTITRKAFEKRRKMMRSSLKELFAPHIIEENLNALGINPYARPEELSIEEFILFASALFSEKT